MQLKEIKDLVTSMNDPIGVKKLLDNLNFNNYSEPQKLNPKSLDLRKKERKNVKTIYTLNDYSNTLRTFLIEVSEVNNTLLNSLPEFFEMRLRYPFIILTDDYEVYHFVLIGKERKGRGKFETKIIKMKINKNNPKRTPLKILNNLQLSVDIHNPLEIYDHLKDALDVEAVTKSFYNNYKDIFDDIKNYFYNQKPNVKRAKERAHRFSHQLLNRIMFIHFIQKKGWLGNNEEFISWIWDYYRKEKGLNNTFYRNWLSVLFFEAFNNEFEVKYYLPTEVNNILMNAPFLNGGLFTENELDKIGYEIEDDYFIRIFEFFNKYNFTIKEDTPLEIDVAVDPEMIGKVYESLVNVSEESGERSDAGIFYTDRVEIDLMSKRSLVEYFNNHLELNKNLIYDLIFSVDKKEKRKADKKLAEKKYWGKIRKLINEVKIVDPACGSGSFLIGLLEILTDLYKRSFKYTDENLAETNFEIKKKIIGRSLFGVDIMQWAVDIAELRLWLQLIVETDIEKHDLKEEPLLPNLSFNIRQGDSLIQEIGGKDFSFGAFKSLNLFGKVKKSLKELTKGKYKFFKGEENSKFRSENEIKNPKKNFIKN
ncbi:MAG: DNA methyltransferase [archaeon]